MITATIYSPRKGYSERRSPAAERESIDGILMPLFGVPVYIPPKKCFPVLNMQLLITRIIRMEARMTRQQEKLIALQERYLKNAERARFFSKFPGDTPGQAEKK